jgi:hypothetical protein
LLSQREKRHAPAAMTIQRIKCRSYLLLRQPLPQPLSKLLPFPAILFVHPPSVRISLGGGIHPRIFGIVLVTVPRGNNHLSRRDVPENYIFGRLEPDDVPPAIPRRSQLWASANRKRGLPYQAGVTRLITNLQNGTPSNVSSHLLNAVVGDGSQSEPPKTAFK